ncbi:MAG TPA: envelope stress response membrane protein PspB [Casimicrobiaceae bacterium]|nr:envelope stress response membrane protein PspB [Casimicrobiaceae bacterium]
MEDGLAVFAILIGSSLICFVLFVMPIWIFMHYKSKNRPQAAAVAHAASLTDEDAADLINTAERMEKRVAALEAIMDAEAPGWRKQS